MVMIALFNRSLRLMRNFTKFRIINSRINNNNNNSLMITRQFSRMNQINKRFYYNPSQSVNTKDLPNFQDNKDENVDTYQNPTEHENLINPGAVDSNVKNNRTSSSSSSSNNSNLGSSSSSSNIHDLKFSEKLKKVYKKTPYTNETNVDRQHNQDPMSVMYSNLAKDEDLNAKDNHISDDDKDSRSSSSGNRMHESLFGMSSSQNDNISTSNKSRVTSQIHNKQNISEKEDKLRKQFSQEGELPQGSNYSTNHVFHTINQEENFRDSYVGDVEYKIPSQNFTKQQKRLNEQDTENNKKEKKNEQENVMDYPKPFQAHNQNLNQSQKNQNQNQNQNQDQDKNTPYSSYSSYSFSSSSSSPPSSSTSTSSSSSSSPLSSEQNKGRNPETKTPIHEQAKKLSASNADLDLSTKNFQKKMEEYKQTASSNDTDAKKYSANEDYFLKDNNSEYNVYINNDTNDNKNDESSSSLSSSSSSYNKNNFSEYQDKDQDIYKRNSNDRNMNMNMNDEQDKTRKKTESKYSLFPSEKDREIEFDVYQTFQDDNNSSSSLDKNDNNDNYNKSGSVPHSH